MKKVIAQVAQKNTIALFALLALLVGAALCVDAAFGIGISGAAAVVNLLSVPNIRLVDYAYPSGAHVEQVQGDGFVYHNIRVLTDVSGVLTAIDGTGYGLAPIGTVIVQALTATPRIHVKTTDATWLSLTPA